ncbi:MAG: glucose-1-phosphate thymidylyltransferase RfbA [Proteobacteria bacterium]|nr:glucose-1-phosphate thymidylyltransferase RfbA [Pseudomonadota bacterium]
MKNRKGIILAGGSGTRLYPLTKIISKHLLPIFDKPMIFYPISTLMLAGIRDILIISTPRDVPQYRALLGNGSDWGINITYAIQESPDGLAQAFIIGEDFLNGSPSALILGDNIFYGNNFENKLINASNNSGATIFIYHVQHPQRYGVAELDSSNKVIGLEEKPSNPKSNYAVTGLYFFDEKAPEYAKSIKPSSRGELEITDLNQIYLNNSQLHTSIMSRGYSWFDAGTHQSLLEAQQFVAIIEKHQGLKISCPEEIAYRKKWISENQLYEITSNMKNNYGIYLKNLLKSFK